MRSRVSSRLAIGLVITAVVAGCSSSSTSGPPPSPHVTPVAGPQVAIAAADQVPQPTTIGMIVTDQPSRSVDGKDDLALAAGGEIASYRLSLAAVSRPITLDVKNDLGTSVGAKAAVQQLLAAHVAAIVDASDGPHVAAAVHQAEAAGTPSCCPTTAIRVWLPRGRFG